MIDQIISAMKLSLNECKKHEDPARYIYELNMVLNRYKTNLFKLMENKHQYIQDPQEFFQFRINTSWVTRPGFGRVAEVSKVGPVLLHVNGYRPYAHERKNKEVSFNKAVRIDDVIDIRRIASVKTDHYSGLLMSSPLYKTENDIISETIGEEKHNETSLYLNVEKNADDTIYFNMQLNATVDTKVVAKHHIDSAGRQPDSPLSAKKKEAKEAAAKLRRENFFTEELPKEEPKVIELFGKDTITTNVTAASVKKVQPFRAKNHTSNMKGKNALGMGRSKNKYW